MTGKAMLVLEQKLVDKIDENRGDLNRADFIEFCIDNCLRETEHEEVERKGPDIAEEKPEGTAIYATREEFQEVKRGITNLLRTFLDFFITFGLELGTSKSTETMGHLKSQLRDILGER